MKDRMEQVVMALQAKYKLTTSEEALIKEALYLYVRKTPPVLTTHTTTSTYEEPLGDNRLDGFIYDDSDED